MRLAIAPCSNLCTVGLVGCPGVESRVGLAGGPFCGPSVPRQQTDCHLRWGAVCWSHSI